MSESRENRQKELIIRKKRPKKTLKTTNNSGPGPVNATAPIKIGEIIQLIFKGHCIAPHRFRTQQSIYTRFIYPIYTL